MTARSPLAGYENIFKCLQAVSGRKNRKNLFILYSNNETVITANDVMSFSCLIAWFCLVRVLAKCIRSLPQLFYQHQEFFQLWKLSTQFISEGDLFCRMKAVFSQGLPSICTFEESGRIGDSTQIQNRCDLLPNHRLDVLTDATTAAKRFKREIFQIRYVSCVKTEKVLVRRIKAMVHSLLNRQLTFIHSLWELCADALRNDRS
jgi:hypothetical protein